MLVRFSVSKESKLAKEGLKHKWKVKEQLKITIEFYIFKRL